MERQRIDADAVFGDLDAFAQAFFEFFVLGRLQDALKHAELHPLTVAGEEVGDFFPSFGARNVVGDDIQHGGIIAGCRVGSLGQDCK